MTNKEALTWLYDLRATLAVPCGSGLSEERKAFAQAIDLAISALERDRWISDTQKFPDTDARVVGYFGGGAFNQLRWFDFVTTLSDGSFAPESTERDVSNTHLIAVFQLPEPPKEET